MRIISGKLKSQRFSAPKNFSSRPTTDFAKEGLFNMLENKYSLYDLNILDLCAGTGNITLEFASREAGYITAVDKNYGCVKFIKELVYKHNLQDDVEVWSKDAVKFLEKTTATYDIIFADPPYALEIHQRMLNVMWERELLNPGGLVIIEHGRETNLENEPNFDFCRKFGNVHFSFFKLAE